MIKHFQRKEKGFTLIELLVVIAVIGLLASIVLVSLGPAREKARDARRQSDIRQINLAMEMCYDDASCAGDEQYPNTAAGANSLANIDTDSSPLYLAVPTDPKDTDPYQYTWTDGTAQFYCVYVQLEAIADTTYFCASQMGAKEKAYPTGAPSNDDCCGFDVNE